MVVLTTSSGWPLRRGSLISHWTFGLNCAGVCDYVQGRDLEKVEPGPQQQVGELDGLLLDLLPSCGSTRHGVDGGGGE
jgi:hypothetical protein